MSEKKPYYNSGNKRDRIFSKSSGLCWYCGSTAEQVDHFVPRFLGGSNDESNLVPVCKWCNKSKRGLSLEDWRTKRAAVEGFSFTEAQRSRFPNLPKDKPYLFFFEVGL